MANKGNSRDQEPTGGSVRLSEILKKAERALYRRMGPRYSRRDKTVRDVKTGGGTDVEGLGKSRRRMRREEAGLDGGDFLGSGLELVSGGREAGTEMSPRTI